MRSPWAGAKAQNDGGGSGQTGETDNNTYLAYLILNAFYIDLTMWALSTLPFPPQEVPLDQWLEDGRPDRDRVTIGPKDYAKHDLYADVTFKVKRPEFMHFVRAAVGIIYPFVAAIDTKRTK
jgi:hypothetical protein